MQGWSKIESFVPTLSRKPSLNLEPNHCVGALNAASSLLVSEALLQDEKAALEKCQAEHLKNVRLFRQTQGRLNALSEHATNGARDISQHLEARYRWLGPAENALSTEHSELRRACLTFGGLSAIVSAQLCGVCLACTV